MKTRPVGITILAVLTFLNVAIYGALLGLSLFSPDTLTTVLRTLSPGGSGPEIQFRMGRMLPLYYSVGIAGTLLIGLGFWKLWNWARIVVLVMMGLSSVALVIEAPQLFASHNRAGIALWLFRLSLCAFFGWYLTSGRVREAFRGKNAAAPVSPGRESYAD